MNKQIFFFLILSFFQRAYSTNNLKKLYSRSIDVAEYQCKMMSEKLLNKLDQLPKSIDHDGKLLSSKSSWWTSGFFPGTLWLLYEATGDEEIRKYAEEYTKRVEVEQYTTSNHDVGFMIYCSVGNSERLVPDKNKRDILMNAAKSLSTRYRKLNGCIQSWNIEDWNKNRGWQCPVIIDNMMNLELLMWAYKNSGNAIYKNIACSHADITLKNQFRDNSSCYHVVSYDTIYGLPHYKGTHQGYSDESVWARGQAWAIYGYTMMYRETKNEEYLKQATRTADYIINHPSFPIDGIPYWDFNDPKIPLAERDASAAAIMSSALFELCNYVSDKKKHNIYLEVALKQIKALSSPVYLSEPGENCGFILKHSVGNHPGNSEIDVPLTYADYYYVEALLRMKNLFGL